MKRIGLLKVCFCWGSLDGICISCEVPSIADTRLGISEQYLFFCHQTGMVGFGVGVSTVDRVLNSAWIDL
jgi:hypothetical protein